MKNLNTEAQNVIINRKVNGKTKRICQSPAFVPVKDQKTDFLMSCNADC